MKLGYFADGKWSHEAFQLLINDPDIEIKFICVRNDTQDPVLLELSKQFNIPYLKHPNINSIEFIEQIKYYECDLFVSMSFNQIFKKEIINLPKLGITNCHAGKLPFYRGRNILNWVLINDETEFGITVHYVNEGIDTGDIILQRCFPIVDLDDYSTLLEKAHLECARLLYDAIKLIQMNEVKVIHQEDIHPIGFYCCMRQIGDEIIDWDQKSRDVFNFIRAICKPGPTGISYINDAFIKINKAKMISSAPIYKGICGAVVGKTTEGLIIKVLDGSLEIKDYEYHGRKIRIGDRFLSQRQVREKYYEKSFYNR